MQNIQQCIFFQLAKANQKGGRFWSGRIERFNVTAVQGLVLAFLHEEDRVTSAGLGKRAQLDSATLTGIIDRLEAAKLVERQNNPDDRRAILICLTEQGKDVARELVQEAEEANETFLSRFTTEERKSLSALLGKLME